jgi:hypothetical protein
MEEQGMKVRRNDLHVLVERRLLELDLHRFSPGMNHGDAG